MNRFLMLAVLFMVCALMNFVNVFLSGNGFSFVLGGMWLAASAISFLRYRKDKRGKEGEEEK